MKKLSIFFIVLLITLMPLGFVFHHTKAQSNTVALLTVNNARVELRRSSTSFWIGINLESVVGVGDELRTDENGQATLLFMTSGLSVVVEPNSHIRIDKLTMEGEGFQIGVEVIEGHIRQILSGEVDPVSSFEFASPALRVNLEDGEIEMLVQSDGATEILTTTGRAIAIVDESDYELEAGFGMRTAADGATSAVLPASSFDQLNSAIDGLSATVTTAADVQLNVRQGPGRDNTVIGTISPSLIDTIMGISENGQWYRIPFEGSYGWFMGNGLLVLVDKDNLITFANDHIEVIVETVISPEAAEAAEKAITNDSISVFNAYTEEELTLIAALNAWRMEEGLTPFAPNDTLTRMARDQADYLSGLSTLPSDIHADSRGRNPRIRAVSSDYEWPYYGQQARVAIGENGYIGRNVDTAINWWRSSSLHSGTILSEGYREIGVAAVPHRLGYIYITVFGSRPNGFPPIYDQATQTLYLSNEFYQYANRAGEWIPTIKEYQFVDDSIAEINEDGWLPFASEIVTPRTGVFAIALRSDDQIVVIPVNTERDILIVPDILTGLP